MSTAVWDWKSQYHHESPASMFDCQLAEFLLTYGRFVSTPEKTMKKYQVTTLAALAEKQQQKLASMPPVQQLFTQLEMPMIPVLWQMEQAGIVLDAASLQQVGEHLDTAIQQLEQKLQTEAVATGGGEINLKSSVQVGNFLAEKLQVPLKKTKTGRFATNEAELTTYTQQYPFINTLLQYREFTKLRSTYIDSLIAKVGADGRVHTTYSLVTAATGRLSSTNPNLQNIPVSSEYGLRIKSCFTAGKGKTLLSFDYSQQELRILAHLSQEPALIAAFNQGQDIHTTTAAQVFEIPYDQVTRAQRSMAKTINFGLIYGMSSYGLSTQLQIPVDSAQQFMAKFYATYPRIKDFFEEYLNRARTQGFAETILGRRRYVFEYEGQSSIDNATRRVLINFPIQGSAADIIKKAMIEVHKTVVAEKLDCQLLLQIHDDLLFEVPDEADLIKKVVKNISQTMCESYRLSVPIEVEVKKGYKWGELERVRLD